MRAHRGAGAGGRAPAAATARGRRAAAWLQPASRVVRTAAWRDAGRPETYGSAAGLTHRLARLRQLLGDDPKRPQSIDTCPGQGSRFLGLPLGRAVGAEDMLRTRPPVRSGVGRLATS